jgi:hypothetical protein
MRFHAFSLLRDFHMRFHVVCVSLKPFFNDIFGANEFSSWDFMFFAAWLSYEASVWDFTFFVVVIFAYEISCFLTVTGFPICCSAAYSSYEIILCDVMLFVTYDFLPYTWRVWFLFAILCFLRAQYSFEMSVFDFGFICPLWDFLLLRFHAFGS